MILMLVCLPLLVLASGFFSGSETALFSLSAQHQRRLTRDGIAGHALGSLLHETRTLLITLLLSNMTVNVLYFVISTVVLIRLREHVHPAILTLLTVLPLLLIILLGEVMPKLVAARMTATWARTAAVPLLGVHRLLAPIRIVTNALVITPLARLIAPRQAPAALSSLELEALLSFSQTRGVIDPHEENVLQQVLSLNQLKVADIMTPRVDIVAFDMTKSLDELYDLAARSGRRHVPVYDGDLDHIEGLIEIKQVLIKNPQTRDELFNLVRNVGYVPEQQSAEQLLLHFRKKGTTLVIVVDEYGGTAGLATLEDVVEQIVGDIDDPTDPRRAPSVEQLGEGDWRVSADLPIHGWRQVLGALHADEDVASLGGLVMAKLGRVPRQGEHVDLGNVRITVASMRGRRIGELRISLRDKEASS